MKSNLASFLLILLLAWVSTAQLLGFGVVGNLTKSAFNCLKQLQLPGQTVPFGIIRVFSNSGPTPTINIEAVNTLNNAEKAGYQLFTYMQICRGHPSIAQVSAVVDVIFSGASATELFIKVEPSNNPICSWEVYSHIDNCNYLKGAINDISSLIGSVGVFSTARIWELYFGNSCDDIASMDAVPDLWYANYENSGHVNSNQSFDDYVPFGGWTVPLLKQIYGNITINLCDNINWPAFVDIIWANP